MISDETDTYECAPDERGPEECAPNKCAPDEASPVEYVLDEDASEEYVLDEDAPEEYVLEECAPVEEEDCEIDFEQFIDNTVIEQIDEAAAETHVIVDDTVKCIVIKNDHSSTKRFDNLAPAAIENSQFIIVDNNGKPLTKIRERPMKRNIRPIIKNRKYSDTQNVPASESSPQQPPVVINEPVSLKAPTVAQITKQSMKRPTLSISVIIALALRNSREGILRLKHIYKFFSRHFMFYKSTQANWRPWVLQTLMHSNFTGDVLFMSEKGLEKGKNVRFWAVNQKIIVGMNKKIRSDVLSQFTILKGTMVRPENLIRMLRGELKHGFKGEHEKNYKEVKSVSDSDIDPLDFPDIDDAMGQEHGNVTEEESESESISDEDDYI